MLVLTEGPDWSINVHSNEGEDTAFGGKQSPNFKDRLPWSTNNLLKTDSNRVGFSFNAPKPLSPARP